MRKAHSATGSSLRRLPLSAQTPHAEILRVNLDALGFVRGAGYTYGEWIDEAEPVGH